MADETPIERTARRQSEPRRCAEAEIDGLLCPDCIPLGDCRQFIDASLTHSSTPEKEDRHETA